jgi:hypothetical protein
MNDYHHEGDLSTPWYWLLCVVTLPNVVPLREVI